MTDSDAQQGQRELERKRLERVLKRIARNCNRQQARTAKAQ